MTAYLTKQSLRCRKCFSEISATDKFCSNCGLKVEKDMSIETKTPQEYVTCQGCNKPMKAEDKFCPNCGKEAKPKPGQGDGDGGIMWILYALIGLFALMVWT